MYIGYQLDFPSGKTPWIPVSKTLLSFVFILKFDWSRLCESDISKIWIVVIVLHVEERKWRENFSEILKKFIMYNLSPVLSVS